MDYVTNIGMKFMFDDEEKESIKNAYILIKEMRRRFAHNKMNRYEKSALEAETLLGCVLNNQEIVEAIL